MIVAKTKCYFCDCEIELDDEYGWNISNAKTQPVVCGECFIKYGTEEHWDDDN